MCPVYARKCNTASRVVIFPGVRFPYGFVRANFAPTCVTWNNHIGGVRVRASSCIPDVDACCRRAATRLSLSSFSNGKWKKLFRRLLEIRQTVMQIYSICWNFRRKYCRLFYHEKTHSKMSFVVEFLANEFSKKSSKLPLYGVLPIYESIMIEI